VRLGGAEANDAIRGSSRQALHRPELSRKTLKPTEVEMGTSSSRHNARASVNKRDRLTKKTKTKRRAEVKGTR
jgi:hypothetical protein